ncbi:MAG: replication-relaxation family protein [Geminicoccaceae bacterium]
MNFGELKCREERQIERLLSGASISRLPASERLPPSATTKQLDILAALTVLRFACVDRLSLYLPRYVRGIQRSLEVLRSRRLVSWFRWVDTTGIKDGLDPLPTTPVYCLTTKGVERCILDRVIEDDTYMLTRSWRGKPVLHSGMPHQLGIVDIVIGLSIASRRSPTHEIFLTVPDFVNEEIDGKARVATIELLGGKNEFRPDLIAYARAKISGKFFTLYIELERKNKGSGEINGKFDNYSALFQMANRRFDKGKPILLYVITPCIDPKDTENRVKLVRSWVKNKPVAPAFRITSLDRLKENAFGPIWQKSDGSAWGIGQ